MTREKFEELWKGSISNWLNSSFTVDKTTYKVSEYCFIDTDKTCDRIYQNYERLKGLVKTLYFEDTTKKISGFKRAAVIMYAIIAGKDPLEYLRDEGDIPLYLKQRLAVYVALMSIIQDYEVDQTARPIFDFSQLGKNADGDDDFLTSVYKDLFFSEIYENYNVLTMANVFGLLIENTSALKKISNDNDHTTSD